MSHRRQVLIHEHHARAPRQRIVQLHQPTMSEKRRNSHSGEEHRDRTTYHNEAPKEQNVESFFNSEQQQDDDSSSSETKQTIPPSKNISDDKNSTLFVDELPENITTLIGLNISDPTLKPIFSPLNNNTASPCTNDITIVDRNETTGSLSSGITTTTAETISETNEQRIKSTEINFYYQIETLTSSSNEIEKEDKNNRSILQVVENEISERLIPTLFTDQTVAVEENGGKECASPVVAKKRLFHHDDIGDSSLSSDSDHVKRSSSLSGGIAGFQSLPLDEFLDRVPCIGELTDTQNGCNVVNGKITIFTKQRLLQDGTGDLSSSPSSFSPEKIETIRNSIRKILENDKSFISNILNKERSIVNVSYRNTTTLPEGINSGGGGAAKDNNNSNDDNNVDRNTVGGENKTDTGLPIYAWTLIGFSVLVVALLIQFIQRRQRKRGRRQLFLEDAAGESEELHLQQNTAEEEVHVEQPQQENQPNNDLSSSYSSSEMSSSSMSGNEGDGIMMDPFYNNTNNGLLGIQPPNTSSIDPPTTPMQITSAMMTTTTSPDEMQLQSPQQEQMLQIQNDIPMSWTDLIASRLPTRLSTRTATTSTTRSSRVHNDGPPMGISPRQPQPSQPREFLIAPSLQQTQNNDNDSSGGELETTWEVLELV